MLTTQEEHVHCRRSDRRRHKHIQSEVFLSSVETDSPQQPQHVYTDWERHNGISTIQLEVTETKRYGTRQIDVFNSCFSLPQERRKVGENGVEVNGEDNLSGMMTTEKGWFRKWRWMIETSQDIWPAFWKCRYTYYHILHSPHPPEQGRQLPYLMVWKEASKSSASTSKLSPQLLGISPQSLWLLAMCWDVKAASLKDMVCILEELPRAWGATTYSRARHTSVEPHPQINLLKGWTATLWLAPTYCRAPWQLCRIFFKQINELPLQRDQEPQFQRSAGRRRMSHRRKGVSSPHWESLNQKLWVPDHTLNKLKESEFHMRKTTEGAAVKKRFVSYAEREEVDPFPAWITDIHALSVFKKRGL